MIDTHCHLTDPRLLEQINNVLARAQSAGVAEMVTIGVDPGDWQAAIELTKKYSNVRCAVGVHPNNCHEVPLERIDDLPGYAADQAVVAIGEIGLDYYHHDAPPEMQAKYFEAQLGLALQLELPVVIHCREAIDDCLSMLSRFPKVRAVFHCFTGTTSDAERIWSAGHLTGFTGVVTFRNGRELLEIAAQAPRDRILVETDAPYLTPEPMRKQKVNEPAMVMHTAAAIAQARKISLQELDEITTGNAKAFYRWTTKS
jgi:TatD DNase family protein